MIVDVLNVLHYRRILVCAAHLVCLLFPITSERSHLFSLWKFTGQSQQTSIFSPDTRNIILPQDAAAASTEVKRFISWYCAYGCADGCSRAKKKTFLFQTILTNQMEPISTSLWQQNQIFIKWPLCQHLNTAQAMSLTTYNWNVKKGKKSEALPTFILGVVIAYNHSLIIPKEVAQNFCKTSDKNKFHILKFAKRNHVNLKPDVPQPQI